MLSLLFWRMLSFGRSPFLLHLFNKRSVLKMTTAYYMKKKGNIDRMNGKGESSK